MRASGNVVADCGNTGILVSRDAEGEDATIVTQNRVSHIRADSGGTGQNGNGFNLDKANGVIVADNRIDDCAFSAIRCYSSDAVNVTGNIATQSGEMALYVEFAWQGAIVANNQIDGGNGGISMTNFAEQGGRLGVCSGNIVRNITGGPTYPDGNLQIGAGIAAEADAAISGNVVEDAVWGLQLGWGPYLRDVSATGNIIRRTKIGIAVSVVEGVGRAIVANNLISGAAQVRFGPLGSSGDGRASRGRRGGKELGCEGERPVEDDHRREQCQPGIAFASHAPADRLPERAMEGSMNSPADEKLLAEAEKLRAEARDLQRPPFGRPGTWIPLLLAIGAGMGGVLTGYFQWQLSISTAATSQLAAERKQLEADRASFQLTQENQRLAATNESLANEAEQKKILVEQAKQELASLQGTLDTIKTHLAASPESSQGTQAQTELATATDAIQSITANLQRQTGTVFLQFKSSVSRDTMGALQQALKSFGYNVPGFERVDRTTPPRFATSTIRRRARGTNGWRCRAVPGGQAGQAQIPTKNSPSRAPSAG